MGQKVHPLGFRVGITQPHLSQWYASKRYYSQYVLEDNFIRTILLKKYKRANFSKIHISRKTDNHFEIVIHAQNLGILIGTKSEKLKLFQKQIKEFIFHYRQSEWNSKLKVVLHIFRCKTSASSIADFIVEHLERRVPYKVAFNLLKKHLQRQERQEHFDSALGILGMKIQISGRLNGAEIARQASIREGRLPLQTLQAHIDYHFQQAYTMSGILGVKVWVLKNVTTKTYKI
uniref:Small ribosomal subunit protein uS3c n=1 Tax=Halimeda tuna TaxID=170433 RepID=A0A6M3W863_9CHLO|nr:ribosomal protein S3 [Halimeda tuna]QJF53523.1 ribosomal protein S3 [Halimeda tuna]QJF53529.1 ribosomal protein S3 [Halimeda tuna]QJF53531.1 ribosomal protein S3 [Halimeda tuna]